jgi:hypothetical protein
MVLKDHGVDAWEHIRQQAGVDDVVIGMEQYPDESTFALVGAACELLGAEPAAVLEGFGAFWIDFVVDAYGELFAMSGDTFADFVCNLNTLHTRVGQIMPDLRPPSFTVTDRTDDSFVLHYHSIRAGLHPMILGLLAGLGRHFGSEVEIEHLRGESQGHDHDEFLVRHRARS